MRKLLVVLPLLSLMGAQCGSAGNCTVTKDAAAGVATITCPDGTSVDVAPGQNGTNGTNGTNGEKGDTGAAGTNCTVTKDADAGVTTIACADGTTATVADGAAGQNGTSCSATRDADAGTTTVSCADGTSAVIPDGQMGAQGPQGPAGPAGDAGMVLTDVEAPGANCDNGGVKLTSGSTVRYVCNGSASNLLAVNAGPDQTVTVGSTVTLAGSAANSALGVRWNQLLGPTLTLSNLQSPTATFTAPSYSGASMRKVVLQLLATDGVRVESDLVVLTLNNPPTAPVAGVTPSNPADGDDVVCAVTTPSTDADGDAVVYAFSWTKNGQSFSGATPLGGASSVVSASQTLDGNVFVCTATASDGAATATGGAVSVTVRSVYASCKALLTSATGTPDGLYDIDPDGNGPIAPVKAFCDMTNGGWTLVANIYDSAGDDAPNSTDYVVSGWQQTGSGSWARLASKLDRDATGTGSAAVSMAFVAALKASAGQQNLKMCFVHQNGADTTCRSSADGTLTLVSYPTGNPKLTAYSGNTLPYTFGRLAGLAGSVDGYNYATFNDAVARIPVALDTVPYRFGITRSGCSSTGSVIETPDPPWRATAHFLCDGMSYRPWESDDNELGAGTPPASPVVQPNPSVETYGFRLYVGP